MNEPNRARAPRFSHWSGARAGLRPMDGGAAQRGDRSARRRAARRLRRRHAGALFSRAVEPADRLVARRDHARRRTPGSRRRSAIQRQVGSRGAARGPRPPRNSLRSPIRAWRRISNSPPPTRGSRRSLCRPTSSCSAWAKTATRRLGSPAPRASPKRSTPARARWWRRSARAAPPKPRLTLTGRVILRARAIALHIEGAAKLATLDKALGDGPVEAMPIRAVLRQAADRLTIFAATA